jgi:excisionase family DNA binding protein
MSNLIKIIDAAKILNVSRDTMYTLCKTKGFPLIALPTPKSVTYRIDREKLEQWINEKRKDNEGA